ncbi:MAG: tol-pal system YbgF family protein [Limisphaerales bacterium]
MNPSLKLASYAVTVIGILVFGILFSRSWRQLNGTPPSATQVRPASSEAPAAPATLETGGTNSATASATNAVAGTPAEAAAVGEPEPRGEVGATTDREAPVEMNRVQISGRGWSRLLLWGFFGLISLAGLGSLIAYDVSHYAGNRATDALFDDEGEGIPESIEDQVNKAYADGDFLEAVRLLRDHLGTNPKSVETQIRIAELYEKDLNNPLAAALEYEEVLKLPLTPEKRGWTGVHLVNLYNRLEKPDLAVAWLQRVVVECPGTPAAVKAQDRLEAAGLEVPKAQAQARSPQRPEEPPSNLPPGFRPRGS